ncbi:hypothetical protein DPX16_9922 [Anabarilius grahami]|uniref:Uncharacterized protein n=1 Tax=Anabarilius grahami TaxID=495550 RepID=A0A3N0Y593_ANAGA|nr:hypothetical protein DPX16_9922 [Anabarilius grahami]
MEGTLKVTIMYESTVEAAESNKSIFPAGGSNLKGTQSPSEDCICPCQARRVLPPFCCRCQARGQADLPKVPSPPYAQHGPLLYLCIHRTADLMSVLISGRNLLFHWDRTDPEKPDNKDTQSCAPNGLS